MTNEEKCCTCFHWRTQEISIKFGDVYQHSLGNACALSYITHAEDSGCSQWTYRDLIADKVYPDDDPDFVDTLRCFMEVLNGDRDFDVL